VVGTPYDTPVPGYNNNTVNKLRLWSARASEEFNFQVFDARLHPRCGRQTSPRTSRSSLSQRQHAQGRELRLSGSTSLLLVPHDIRHLRNHDNFDCFPEKVAIQLNDTHPSIGLPSGLLVDEHKLDWDKVASPRTRSRTPTTLLAEALERWP